jgi:DNA-binding NarL/FixJ family response regulator
VVGRLLLADSEQLTNQAFQALLVRQGGHQVVAGCSTAEQFLAAVREHRPDLALVDARLAGLDPGPSALEVVRRTAPETRVLVMAERPDLELVMAAIRAHAVGVVSKTSDARTILRAVRAALLGEGVVPRAMLPVLFEQLVDAAAAPDPIDLLSPRERQVLALMGRGLDNIRIARELSISPNTVRTHVQNVLTKLGMHSKLEAVRFAP